MILRKETETSSTLLLSFEKLTIIRMNDTPQGDGNLQLFKAVSISCNVYKNE